MSKLWAGRTAGITEKLADDFNSSISFDSRMYKQDIEGSIAHAAMLSKAGIITPEEKEELTEGLKGILSDLSDGSLEISPDAEDIHMFVEEELTKRIGDTGKKLHTARSRNDQVALDMRLYLREKTDIISGEIKDLLEALTDKAEEYKDFVMPGYTHLQRAQPVTFGHYLMAYAQMFIRDMQRLSDCRKRINVSPIGSCALAGTTYDTDRFFEAGLLGFDSVCDNSMDGVSDRDFCVELLSVISMIMMHLSRLAEEFILWSGLEFRFIELSDGYTTGSSIMPQKRNPDMAELVRGKSGRVFGDLMGILTVFKGLPLSYNKDMQEDKEGVFDAVDTVEMCLKIFKGMIRTMKANRENMASAAKEGFLNATDLADYLVSKGMPFRSAYKICGEITARCIEEGKTLEDLDINVYKGYSPLFDEDLYGVIDIKACAERRTSYGGTSVGSVELQIKKVRDFLSDAG